MQMVAITDEAEKRYNDHQLEWARRPLRLIASLLVVHRVVLADRISNGNIRKASRRR